MFRLWAKEMQNGKIIRHMTVEDASSDSRTKKVFHALTTVCREFDLEEPIWLDKNVKEFRQYGKCRFLQDNFVETIPFEFLEMEIIEEDEA